MSETPIYSTLVGRLKQGEAKALVFQTAFLGDVVLMTPLLRAFRKAFPLARLTTAVLPECAEIVRPRVDDVIPVDKRSGGKEMWEELLTKIRDSKFDLAISPHRSIRSGRLLRQAGIPVRIGFDRGGGALYHTERVSYPAFMYEGERNLKLLERLVTTDDNGVPELIFSGEVERNTTDHLHRLGLAGQDYVVVAPGSVWTTKRWGSFEYLAERIFKEWGYPTVAIGSRSEYEVCTKVTPSPEFNFAGRLTPLESAALMARARAFIGNDSAATHLATGVGARQLIIFGSTAPRFGFLPPVESARVLGLDIGCRPCTDHGRQACPRFASPRCLDQVSVEMVIKSIQDWLEK